MTPLTTPAPVAKETVSLPVPQVSLDNPMATDPAETIAKASKLVNTTFIILGLFGVKFAASLPDQVDTWVQIAFGLGVAGYTWWSTIRQGKKTAAAVYSPASVQTLVLQAKAVGQNAPIHPVVK